jgi:hypothetical protein
MGILFPYIRVERVNYLIFAKINGFQKDNLGAAAFLFFRRKRLGIRLFP